MDENTREWVDTLSLDAEVEIQEPEDTDDNEPAWTAL
jgi:hypothetical protein